MENLDYIPEYLLDLVRNYISPTYAMVEEVNIVKSINNNTIDIGDNVWYKKENIELIVKSIEKIDGITIVSFFDGTELEADSENKIDVYKN